MPYNFAADSFYTK